MHMRPGDTHLLLLLWHQISRVSNRLLFIYNIGIYTAEGTSLLWRGKQHLSLSTIYPCYLDTFLHHFMYTKHLYLLFTLLTLLRTTSLNTEQPRIRNDFINQQNASYNNTIRWLVRKPDRISHIDRPGSILIRHLSTSSFPHFDKA